jgi:hypothetical protein
VIHHLIGAVRKDIAALDAAVSEGAALADLALALDELRTARAELDTVAADLEAAVVRAMGGRWETSIDGLGGIKVHGGKKRTRWRHDELWPRGLTQARRLGPLPGTNETEAETTLRVIRDAVQPQYWRAKVLKGWGIDPDEFCEVSWGRKTVEIVR